MPKLLCFLRAGPVTGCLGRGLSRVVIVLVSLGVASIICSGSAFARENDTKRYSEVFLAQYSSPPSRIVDDIGYLRAAERDAIEESLSRFECRHGAQMTVLLIRSTGRQFIEDFSLAVASRWRLGRATKDDGVLLTIASEDRRLRIEIGPGLEAVLPEKWLTGGVIATMSALLRQDQRAAAIETAISRISSRLPVLRRDC